MIFVLGPEDGVAGEAAQTLELLTDDAIERVRPTSMQSNSKENNSPNEGPFMAFLHTLCGHSIWWLANMYNTGALGRIHDEV